MKKTRLHVSKSAIAGLLIVVCFGVSFTPQTVSAQQVQYQPQTTEQQIIFLLGMIAQLQELLNLMKERDGNNSSGSGSSSGGGGGGGTSSNNSSADITVSTLSARAIEKHEAELLGEVDFHREKKARVWFQYGEDDDDLDERTTRRRVTDSRGDELTFTETIDDLDEGERYYFRAVAEDEDGEITYGSIRSFTTDGDSRSRGGFELTVSDTLAEVGDEIEIEWEVPRVDVGSRNWIGLYERGADDKKYIAWKYLSYDRDGEVSFEMKKAGVFEFRLFLSNSYNEEVTSRTVTVR